MNYRRRRKTLRNKYKTRRPQRSPFLCIVSICAPVILVTVTLAIGRFALNTPMNEEAVEASKTATATMSAAHKIKGPSLNGNEIVSASVSTTTTLNGYGVDVYSEDTYHAERNLDEVGAAIASYKFGILSGEKYSKANQNLLLKLTMAEAEGESIEGKALVIRTIFNRVASDAFPDSIEEVVYQKGQFEPVSTGVIYDKTPNAECYEAMDMVILDDWDESQGALYFEATYNGTDTWHTNSLEYLMTVGGHSFYK